MPQIGPWRGDHRRGRGRVPPRRRHRHPDPLKRAHAFPSRPGP
ncbi:MAG: hypothetical protein [Siphoviridae sp. ctdEk19]|nr:MAG: hypothetical protein [Siphoviridae sp. ctdEk19]